MFDQSGYRNGILAFVDEPKKVYDEGLKKNYCHPSLYWPVKFSNLRFCLLYGNFKTFAQEISDRKRNPILQMNVIDKDVKKNSLLFCISVFISVEENLLKLAIVTERQSNWIFKKSNSNK